MCTAGTLTTSCADVSPANARPISMRDCNKLLEMVLAQQGGSKLALFASAGHTSALTALNQCLLPGSGSLSYSGDS